jgi:hypothetical protein
LAMSAPPIFVTNSTSWSSRVMALLFGNTNSRRTVCLLSGTMRMSAGLIGSFRFYFSAVVSRTSLSVPACATRVGIPATATT